MKCRDISIRAAKLPPGLDVISVVEWSDNPFMSLRAVGRMFGISHRGVQSLARLPGEELQQLARYIKRLAAA